MRTVDIKSAASELRRADRVLVIGCSGSGKSTLSKSLSEKLGIPHISMDREIFWLPGWQARPREEAVARLEAFVASPAWIIDGTSPSTLDMRLRRAQIVIWLRPPCFRSLWGIVRRWMTLRGTTRPEMADNCPEKLDLEFLRYVWNFERTETPQIEDVLSRTLADIPVLTLGSRRQAARLLRNLGRRGDAMAGVSETPPG